MIQDSRFRKKTRVIPFNKWSIQSTSVHLFVHVGLTFGILHGARNSITFFVSALCIQDTIQFSLTRPRRSGVSRDFDKTSLTRFHQVIRNSNSSQS